MAPVVCWLASAAVLRREEDPPGGLRSHGRSGRFTPFAPIAHSGPSHRFLRPRFAGTCLRRAPPPSLVRGWTSHPGGSSSLRSAAAAAICYEYRVFPASLPSQVEAQNVAGRQNSFHLQRQNAPVPDLRRRWNKKCPPATRRWHTCDTASQRGGETPHNQHIRVTDGYSKHTRQLL